MEKTLLPRQLLELYVNLISRCISNDPDSEKLVTIALEVLAITRRPLSILELAWAVALGSAQKKVTTIATLAELVNPQRVIGLIQPFVTHIDFNNVKKRQVRLVH